MNVQAQTPRFKPLVESEMSEAQLKAVREVASGPRGRLDPDGPSALLLRSPELMSRTQKVGEYLRFNSSLPRRLNEFAILITARQWNAQLEWFVHQPLAVKAGLAPAVAADLAQGKRPTGMTDDEEIVYQFCKELHETKTVSDPIFKAAVDKFGERGVIDLIGLTGYYTMLAMVLNVARQPLPNGAPPPLPAL
ncbi:MAG: carboxymuconolactone decarboxylase family protein [Betaproteobacteria bacterium]|nr:carboxymuconolactone decarboxylase family protein [Betaproteobacteria bacterium]